MKGYSDRWHPVHYKNSFLKGFRPATRRSDFRHPEAIRVGGNSVVYLPLGSKGSRDDPQGVSTAANILAFRLSESLQETFATPREHPVDSFPSGTKPRHDLHPCSHHPFRATPLSANFNSSGLVGDHCRFLSFGSICLALYLARGPDPSVFVVESGEAPAVSGIKTQTENFRLGGGQEMAKIIGNARAR